MVRVIQEGAAINGSYADDVSVVIRTREMLTLSVYNKYTVAPSTAKTFISGVRASKVIQDITYTAVSWYGPTGNAITVEYTDGATAGAEVVTVLDSAITVQIEDGVSTATQIKAAWDAAAPAVALATSAITGTGSNAQDVEAETALEGGTGQVDIANNLIQSVAHGFSTGRKFALTTSAADLPAPLTATDYWAIKVTDDTMKFATSLANANAGTAVDLADQGTGTHTMTPAALSACSIKMQESNDGEDWDDISGVTTSITATGVSKFKPDVTMQYLKLVFAIGDGQVEIVSTVCGKG